MDSMTTLPEELDTDRVEEIKAMTWLSERQAQIYQLHNDEEMTLKTIAEKLGLESDTVYDYWRDAKDKVRKSKETIELNIGRA